MVGMDIYTTFRAAPYLVTYAAARPEDAIPDRDYWYSTDPELVDKAFADIKADRHKYQNNYPRNRLAEIRYDVERRQTIIAEVLKAQVGSPEYLRLKTSLVSPNREFFLPERQILVEALSLETPKRQPFLAKKILSLYSKLRHAE